MIPYEKVLTARDKNRALSKDFINNIFDDIIELHGDRRFFDDSAIFGGIAKLNNMPVTVIGIDKGKDLKQRIKNNFGCANPEGYRKSLRLFKQAEKFNRPVICFIDTPGAFCGIGAEERGQGQAIAENIMELISLKVPTISIITGEGGSGGALALAVTDEVWMLENSVYSVISPEGCASILWKDSKQAKTAANSLKLTADDLLNFGVIEKIFKENMPFEKLCKQIKTSLINVINKNKKLNTEELLNNRYDKFRKIGRETK